MKRQLLKEDRLPPKLFVRFSSKIINEIDAIDTSNQGNLDGLSNWHDYLDGMISYISNPVIAWDNTNRHHRLPNGTRFIADFDYNVGYTIKTNNTTQQQYVYVFMANLKPEEFGLIVPQINESIKKALSLIERIENL